MKKLFTLSLLTALSATSFAYDFTSYSYGYQASDYREAINMGLKFFGGQRCGDTHNWMLHENNEVSKKYCHMKDGQGKVNGGGNGNYDLTGGWHDCGDHIKVGTTMGYAAFSLLAAYDIWPKAFQDNYDAEYGPKNGIPDVLDEAKIATDYFMKCFLSNGEFCYYVGDGSDHRVWMTSSKQSEQSVDNGGDPRPVWTSSSIGGPQAANYVSALCLMAKHYPDADYAAKCKKAAIDGYEFAKKNKDKNAAIPEFYGSPNTEWTDELSLAAIMLYNLTGEDSYLADAKSYLAGKWESNSPLAWDTMTDYVYYYLAKIDKSLDNGGGGTYVSFLEKNVFGLHLEKAKGDKNGFPYYSSRWGTNKLALGGATVAALYVKLVEDGVITSSRNIEEAKGFRDRIVDYVMGKNEFNHTFLHGFKGDMHFRLHHRNAMGRNDNPPSNVKNSCEYMFASGGVIGGPSGTGIFENVVEGGASYTETEGGCDYNAPFIAAIASVVEKLDPDPTGVEEVRNTSFSVYPTVIDDYVIVDPIEIGYDGRAEISIVNINGQTVAAESMIGFTPTVIYTSSLPRGIYVLKVNFDGGQKTYKLIKE